MYLLLRSRGKSYKGKEERTLFEGKMTQPLRQWSKELGSVTRKPEENSVTKPDPSLQKIKVTCQCAGLLWANQNTSLPAFRAVSLAQTSRCHGGHLYTLSWQLKDLVISSNLRDNSVFFHLHSLHLIVLRLRSLMIQTLLEVFDCNGA